MGTLSYEELVALEPGLTELEAEVSAAEDDGSGAFYCSNHVWLPLNSKLKGLLGVARKNPDHGPGGVLFDSRSYETAYEHLSKLLPPCRDCGCRLFQPVRDRQSAERD